MNKGRNSSICVSGNGERPTCRMSAFLVTHLKECCLLRKNADGEDFENGLSFLDLFAVECGLLRTCKTAQRLTTARYLIIGRQLLTCIMLIPYPPVINTVTSQNSSSEESVMLRIVILHLLCTNELACISGFASASLLLAFGAVYSSVILQYRGNGLNTQATTLSGHDSVRILT